MKELAEDADREKALKDMAEVTVKEKTKVVATTEKKTVASKKAKAAAEKRFSELEVKLGETELKLVEATSLNTAWAKELVDLRVALEAYENKWYNKGFAYAESFVESVIQEARKLAFEEGWLAALQALGAPEDS